MTKGLAAYPEYKDSGLAWLGDVPAHWEVRRMRDTAGVCIAGIWGGDPDGQNDLVCVRVADFDRARLRVRLNHPTLRSIGPSERRRRLLSRGDLLLEKSGGGDRQPVGVVVLFDHDVPAVSSNFVAKLTVNEGYNPKYLVYLHSTLYELDLNTRSIKQTTGIQNLDTSAYLSESVALPGLPEQSAIVHFLDHADRRIQRYIRAKQKLIKLLQEQKQAIIRRAVTRGFDPSVRLKPTGVEWLGEVPENWRVVRSKRLFSARKALARSDDVQLSATQAYGVIEQSDFEARAGRRVTKLSMHFDQRRHVEKDDFVISMRSFQGGLERAWATGAIRSSYVVLEPRIGVDVDFFMYLFKSHGYIRALQRTANFIRDGQDLTFDNFCSVDLPLVPLEEQRSIAESIATSTNAIEASISRARTEGALLQEYRARLIADVVTGKLDVREAAAHLPKEIEDTEPVGEEDAIDETESHTDDELDAESAEAEA